MQKNKVFGSIELVYYAVATVLALFSVVAWAYNTFESKDVSKMIVERLDRIENKVDQLIGR